MAKPTRSEDFSFFKSNFNNFCQEVIIERFDENGMEFNEDFIIKEERVKFSLNNKKFLSVMCIAQYQAAHIVGFLLSEAIIKEYDDIKTIEVSKDGLSVNVIAKFSQDGYENLFKEKTLTSSCCIGITGNAEKSFEYTFVNTQYYVKAQEILNSMRLFNQPSELFENTGCVHKAQLILEDGTKYTTEDIGRHNAIDKVVGLAIISKKDIKKSILYVSGRLSMEMVVKCVMNKIPIVVSKAAVTFQGTKVANEHGITLIGFARGNKMNIYTHSGRVDG